MGNDSKYLEAEVLEELRFALLDSGLRTRELEDSFLIEGPYGSAEIDIGEQIMCGIEGDAVYYWNIDPTIRGVRSAVTRIKEIIG